MKIKKLSKQEWTGVGLVIASMVLFPYGLLAPSNPIAVVGVVCLSAGILTWKVYDLRHPKTKTS